MANRKRILSDDYASNELYYICAMLSRANKYFRRSHVINLAASKLKIWPHTSRVLFRELEKNKVIKRWKTGRYTLEKHFDERLIDVDNILELYKQ